MVGKMKLYIGLLILGLVMIGAGVWFLVNSAPAINIPEGAPVITANAPVITANAPVITANASYIMRGEFSHLYIYEDGSIVYIEEKGLRVPSPGHPPTRTWKTGHLCEEELESLIGFFRSSNFTELNEYYQFLPPNATGGTMSDMEYTVSITYGDLQKMVRAFGYLTPDGGATYPDTPYPLNEIYQKLRDIALRTKEVARETIS